MAALTCSVVTEALLPLMESCSSALVFPADQLKTTGNQYLGQKQEDVDAFLDLMADFPDIDIPSIDSKALTSDEEMSCLVVRPPTENSPVGFDTNTSIGHQISPGDDSSAIAMAILVPFFETTNDSPLSSHTESDTSPRSDSDHGQRGENDRREKINSMARHWRAKKKASDGKRKDLIEELRKENKMLRQKQARLRREIQKTKELLHQKMLRKTLQLGKLDSKVFKNAM